MLPWALHLTDNKLAFKTKEKKQTTKQSIEMPSVKAHCNEVSAAAAAARLRVLAEHAAAALAATRMKGHDAGFCLDASPSFVAKVVKPSVLMQGLRHFAACTAAQHWRRCSVCKRVPRRHRGVLIKLIAARRRRVGLLTMRRQMLSLQIVGGQTRTLRRCCHCKI